MFLKNKSLNQKGFSLVEILLASGLLGFLALIFLSVLVYGKESTVRAGDRSRAVLLTEEGLEATRSIRDENFSNLVAGTFGLSTANGKWSFSSDPEEVANFTRGITVIDVNAHTKQIISQVSWLQSGGNQLSVSASTLLTDWRTANSVGTSSEFCGI